MWPNEKLEKQTLVALQESNLVIYQPIAFMILSYYKDLANTTRRVRGPENGVIFPYMDVTTPFSRPRRRRVVFAKASFPLGEFVRANRKRSNLIGWRQTLTTSPANHIRFLLVRANKFAKWKTGLSPSIYLRPSRVSAVRLPMESGNASNSLCCKSNDVIFTQFPISTQRQTV